MQQSNILPALALLAGTLMLSSCSFSWLQQAPDASELQQSVPQVEQAVSLPDLIDNEPVYKKPKVVSVGDDFKQKIKNSLAQQPKF